MSHPIKRLGKKIGLCHPRPPKRVTKPPEGRAPIPTSVAQGPLIKLPTTETIQAPRYMLPNAHKLYDFRAEPDFGEIAHTTIQELHTLLDYDRLYTLWQAVANTHKLGHHVAEIGVYFGGSTAFLARAYHHFNARPQIHAFDTFAGHPDVLTEKDGKNHRLGSFNRTSLDLVQGYLAPFENIILHPGIFPETGASVRQETFSLVHVDVDLYKPTADCLDFFYPRLCENGVIVLDDYGFTTCPGVRMAVKPFLETHPEANAWYMMTGQFLIQKRPTH